MCINGKSCTIIESTPDNVVSCDTMPVSRDSQASKDLG
jgi:hypothetical protein